MTYHDESEISEEEFECEECLNVVDIREGDGCSICSNCQTEYCERCEAELDSVEEEMRGVCDNCARKAGEIG